VFWCLAWCFSVSMNKLNQWSFYQSMAGLIENDSIIDQMCLEEQRALMGWPVTPVSESLAEPSAV